MGQGSSSKEPYLTRFDIDGDGVKDRVSFSYTGGAHCCYSPRIFLSSDSTERDYPIWMDGGYVGGVDGSQPDRFRIEDLDGDGLPEVFMRIATYNGEGYEIPEGWKHRFGIEGHRIYFDYEADSLQVRSFPDPSGSDNDNTERSVLSGIAYDSVVAYDYDGEGGRTIIQSWGMPDGVEASRRLNEEEVAAFERLLNDTGTYGGLTGACFDPHLGLVYFHEGRIEAHISICLACNNLRASVDIPAMEHPSHRIRVADGKDSYAKGFSMKAREKLSELCKALDFGHCELRGPKGRYQRGE